jgi:hypothetical protein
MKPMALIAIAIVAGVAAFAFYYQSRHPRKIIGYGSVTATGESVGAPTMTARTRTVEINRVRFQEVEINGSWVDCGGDCEDALKREHLDVWERRKRDGI